MPRVTFARPGHMGQDQVSCSTHLLVYVHIRDRESNRNQHQEHDIETDSLSWMQEQLRTPRASCARLGRMGQDQVPISGALHCSYLAVVMQLRGARKELRLGIGLRRGSTHV